MTVGNKIPMKQPRYKSGDTGTNTHLEYHGTITQPLRYEMTEYGWTWIYGFRSLVSGSINDIEEYSFKKDKTLKELTK